jgi:hypothetical protein
MSKSILVFQFRFKTVLWGCLVLQLFFLVHLECIGQYAPSNYPVHLKGLIQIVHTYKGGVEPFKETLEEIGKPSPMANSKLFVKKTFYGKEYYIIQTDSTGNFDLNIKPGLYNIFLSNEKEPPPKMANSKDEKTICEENFKTQSYGQLKVFNKGNSPVEITIVEKINPCGPLPAEVEIKQE